MSDYDKQQWQAEQAARDAVYDKQREKEKRTRERSARNAQRKLGRLYNKLTELGEISDFEDEFGESVLERLDKFGSAFADREKGRPGDALSFAQKSVLARMNKKVKDLKNKPVDAEPDPDADYVRTADRWRKEQSQPRSSFKSKGKAKFTPRVRHIEDDFIEEPLPPVEAIKPKKPIKPFLRDVTDKVSVTPNEPVFIPDRAPRVAIPKSDPPKPAAPKRPFLRIVTNDGA